MPTARPRRISRFVVMAMLQAARAKRLGLSQGSAVSWGLNRSIFYAAAKKGFRGGGERPPKTGVPVREEPDNGFRLGDELAYRDPKSPELRFTIGGETQTEEAFQKQIASRFGDETHFREAWEESLGVVSQFDEETLRSGRRFYSEVYKPRRDELAEEWTQRYA